MTEFIINKLIRVTASCHHQEPGHAGEIRSVIHFELFYPLHHAQPFLTGKLGHHHRHDVHHKTFDGMHIKGTLGTDVNDVEIIFQADLFYGPHDNIALQYHFDGTLAIFPQPAQSTHHHHSHHSQPHPTDDLPEESTLSTPLFPYIDIQNHHTPAANTACIQYNPANNPFYTQLLADAGNSTSINTLTEQFLAGTLTPNQLITSLSQLPPPINIFPTLYDMLTEQPHNQIPLLHEMGFEKDTPHAALSNTSYTTTIDQVWQNYFAGIISPNTSNTLFTTFNKILIIANLVAQWTTGTTYSLADMLTTPIILPSPIFPLPAMQSNTLPIGSQVGPIAVGNLKMTRYRLLDYQPGEIAQVVNVLKGEKKKIRQRSRSNTSEQTLQQNQNTNATQNEEGETTNELLLEAQKTLASLTKTYDYTNLQTTYGPPTQLFLNGSWKETSAPLDKSTPALKNINSFATQVINKTLQRISESIVRTRSTTRFTEKEDSTQSQFDNSTGHEHFTGLYRWLNKRYRISVEHVGHRLLLQLTIPTPATAYIAAQKKLNDINLEKPVAPADNATNPVKTFNDITTTNYISLLSDYQVTQPMLPPEAGRSISVSLNGSETEKYITIPPGYVVTGAFVNAQLAPNANVNGLIGTTPFTLTANTPKPQPVTMNNEQDQLVVSVLGTALPPQAGTTPPPVQPNEFIVNVTITYDPTSHKLAEWQIAVFQAITEAYQQQLQSFDNNISRFAMPGQQTNPLLLRNIEKGAIHTAATTLLATATASLPTNDQHHQQFIRTAFEWDEMTWHFNDQPTILDHTLQGRNDSLRPFLQATSVNIFLPIQPHLNFQTLYFLSTTTIWPFPWPFIPVNPADQNTITQLRQLHHHNQHQEEKPWTIVLPTDMQIIQENNLLTIYPPPKNHDHDA